MQPEEPIDRSVPSVTDSQVADEALHAPFSPDVYNAIIEQLAPLDVRLVDVVFSLRSPIHSGPLTALAAMELPEVTDQIEEADGVCYVQISHQATFRIVAADEAVAAEGRARFNVRLRLGFAPPGEFWPLFLRRNVKLYTHPALRDLIASLSARAGLVVQPIGSVAIVPIVKAATPNQAKPVKELPVGEARAD